MANRKKLVDALDTAARDGAVRAVAASAAVAAGSAVAAGKVVRDRLARRAEEREDRRYRLGPGESRPEGIGRVARGQLDLAIALLEGREGEDHEQAVHEARKALKRLRALLRLSRDFIGDEVYKRENRTFRDAGRRLSPARDAQVLLETLDGLTARAGGEVPDGAFARFRQHLERQAAGAQPCADGDGEVVEVVTALSAARVRVDLWGIPDGGGPQSLGGGLQRVYRRGRRALHDAEADPTDEHLHELRKRAKDLWHATQLLGPAAGKRMKKVRRQAHRLSDLLGDDHDLAVLAQRANADPHLFGEGELELLSALVERRREALKPRALSSGARLYRRTPRKLRRRLSLSH
jgi:CHAD domain-containing protein